ncbi:IS3 family transposase [Streptomyces chartreusis]|uniref:IS3 family transposase n=2 Tax=Streptomyces chartreusis TaxID=1969 RepID=A0A7H8T3R5_STRCX|nr:IS3 family transposase [Streptomyces chartreusis]
MSDEQLVAMLVERARSEGLQLTGQGGLLQQLTKRVLESALEGEIIDHLGHEKHDPAGKNNGNSRNGTRAKTVLTDVGPVEVKVPRDAAGSFEPQIVKKRQWRLTAIPAPRAAARPDLVLRQFDPDPAGVDTRWCSDITYALAEEGWRYLATVIDIASRRVVGWATADHLRTDLVADALMAACRQRRPAQPVIFHSDRGCQYISQQFTYLATEFGVRLSVGRTGQCWENALAESFFATIKRESLDTSTWPSRAAARTAIFDFIGGWYNPPNTRPALAA